jgi:hypothetical protein
MQHMFGPALIKAVQYALRFANGGQLPKEFERLAVDWSPVTRPIPGITSDAVTKEIAAGAIPARSDVTQKRLGYSALDRQRIAQDFDEAQGAQVLQDIAARLSAAPTPQAQPPAPTPRDVFGGDRNRTAG